MNYANLPVNLLDLPEADCIASPAAALLWLDLHANPDTTMEGVYRLSRRQALSRTRLLPADFDAGMNELASGGLIEWDGVVVRIRRATRANIRSASVAERALANMLALGEPWYSRWALDEGTYMGTLIGREIPPSPHPPPTLLPPSPHGVPTPSRARAGTSPHLTSPHFTAPDPTSPSERDARARMREATGQPAGQPGGQAQDRPDEALSPAMPGDDYLDRLRAGQETPENAAVVDAAERLFGRWKEKGGKSAVPYSERERRMLCLTVQRFGTVGGVVDQGKMRALVRLCAFYARRENRVGENGRDWYTLARMFGSAEKTAALLEESAGHVEPRAAPDRTTLVGERRELLGGGPVDMAAVLANRAKFQAEMDAEDDGGRPHEG